MRLFGVRKDLAQQLSQRFHILECWNPFLQLCFEVSNEGFIHHVVDDLAGGVIRAGLLAGSRFGFRIVVCQQVLEYLAEQLRVESDLFLDGGVLIDGEFIAIEDIDQAAHFVAPVCCAIGLIEINPLLFAEKQKIRHAYFVASTVGEAIDAKNLRGVVLIGFVQALKESAIEERDL
ncbi:MAG: hypothetical protein DDT27_01554 [Dehalococcoidia bacterium]|nr:hypothetical protein [Chloroflexota bacterium]